MTEVDELHQPPPLALMDASGCAVPGIVAHVAPARLIDEAGGETPTFSRGLGRNRVALLVQQALEPGARVRFRVDVDGGTVSGEGRVERFHTAAGIGGAEQWAIVDVDRLDPGSTARLLRILDARRLARHVVEERRRTDALARPKPKPAPLVEEQRSRRPKVSRYAPPEVPDRWRVR